MHAARPAADAAQASAALLLALSPVAHAEGTPDITEVVVDKGKNIVAGPIPVTKFRTAWASAAQSSY
ncbi:hypothetical protein SALBM311S_01004 [Streptomyces alboniger]